LDIRCLHSQNQTAGLTRILADKYLRTTEDSIMDTHDNKLDAQRDIIRHSLPELVNDIGMRMRDEGLHFPVYITVRNHGDSLATIATPLDPSGDDWSRATAIVCQIIQKKIGTDGLRWRELLCAVANAAPMSAADVTAE
jgi:hypothetical protein